MAKYDVAAFIWPAYTGDEPRTRLFWPEGMGEWQSVKNAVKKFPGQNWPRKPLWGYVNEADPYVMEMEIAAAADHGVNVFIYDWYWYDGRPFLENCLNDGFLKAQNNGRMKFYLMWANHDVNYCWDIRNSGDLDTVIWRGGVDEKQFDQICGRMIEKYFSHPLYYTIDGKPVLMIYDIDNLVNGLGGLSNTRRRLDAFRERCVKAGLKGLHLQLTQWGEVTHNLSGVDGGKGSFVGDTAAVGRMLGFDSAANYQYAHFTDIDRDYGEILPDVKACWEKFYRQYGGAYFPHVSIGWDNNPRFTSFRPGIVKGNTPAAFEEALREAKAFLDTHKTPAPLLTLNSWNEWTETSYLEPDDLYGYGYLEAVKRVFPPEEG